jgi:TatD DNase family protein
LREVAAYVPSDRLLIETDSPYLAPVPHRGRSNQPAWVVHVAAKLAEIRGLSVEQIAQLTSENFDQLFGARVSLTRQPAVSVSEVAARDT